LPTVAAPGPQPRLESIAGNSWIQFCDADGLTRVVVNLEDLDQRTELQGCDAEGVLSPAGSFLASSRQGELMLAQMPEGGVVRVLPLAGELHWSPDGRRLLVLTRSSGTTVSVFDTWEDSWVSPDHYDGYIEFMGWSSDSSWAVYSHVLLGTGAPTSALGTVVAVSGDGDIVRPLYDIDSGDWEVEFILGWLSTSTYVSARSVEWCDIELRRVNIVTQDVEILWGANHGAIVDPSSDTVFVRSLGTEICAGQQERGLYRMTSHGGWEPQLVIPGAGDPSWDVDMQWMAEVGLAAVCEKAYLDPDQSLGLRDSSGAVRFRLSCSDEILPSPDGRSILVSQPMPARTRIVNRSGETIADRIILRPSRAVWFPDSQGLVFLSRESGIYAALRVDGWRLQLVDAEVQPDQELVVLNRPERPFHTACEDAPPSRLGPGQTAKVSEQPAIPNRLRSEPGTLQGRVIGLAAPGQPVAILEGPACVEGMVWWRVELSQSGVVGWTAEGVWDGAWLTPLD
jgi:hypothetical protein